MNYKTDCKTVIEPSDLTEFAGDARSQLGVPGVLDYTSLLLADRKLFEVIETLGKTDALPECVLLDVVRLSIADRLEELQTETYRRLDEGISYGRLLAAANTKPV
ncbi:MAG: hypothetical protein WCA81_18805 [Rhizomicrobium sp.]